MNKTLTKIGFFIGMLAVGFSASSFAASTGSFLTTISTQKDSVIALYDSGYNRLYQKFQSSGANLMKSLNYQSLVCLGVMNNGSFLQNMQVELKNLKVDFLNQYNGILTSYYDIEQKRKLYEDTKVNLFSYGSYDKDILALSGSFSELISQQKLAVSNFITTYQKSLTTFLSDYASYLKKNQSLITQVSSKVALLQNLDNRYSTLLSSLDGYRSSLIKVSKSSFFSNTEMLRTASIASFTNSLDKIATAQVKKYRILKNLSGVLLPQRDILVSGFVSYFDQSYSDFLGNWYDNTSYKDILRQMDAIHQSYYSGAVYQCSSILTSSGFDADVSNLIKKITKLSSSLSSGFVATGSFSITGFQKKTTTWFSTVQEKQKLLQGQYTTFVNTSVSSLLAEYKKTIEQQSSSLTGSQSTGSTTILPQPVFVAPAGFSFTQPFTTNQSHGDVSILQGLMKSLGYYSGDINGIYTPSTKDAVYRFQLAKGLLKGYEKKPQTWGWMGPATRSALNNLLK